MNNQGDTLGSKSLQKPVTVEMTLELSNNLMKSSGWQAPRNKFKDARIIQGFQGDEVSVNLFLMTQEQILYTSSPWRSLHFLFRHHCWSGKVHFWFGWFLNVMSPCRISSADWSIKWGGVVWLSSFSVTHFPLTDLKQWQRASSRAANWT